MKLCEKYPQSSVFWCRLWPDHPGCCENGAGTISEPIRGTLEGLLEGYSGH